LNVIWSEDADRDRSEIIDHIWLDSPAAAFRMDAVFQSAAVRLERFPYSGRTGVLPGTREVIPHPSYRMVYEIDDEAVTILALAHTARQWPPVEED
jgi:plasmid stabilization system protein ParE